MIPDHAELYAQKMRENAGGNCAYEALPGMISDSACPPEYAVHRIFVDMRSSGICGASNRAPQESTARARMCSTYSWCLWA